MEQTNQQSAIPANQRFQGGTVDASYRFRASKDAPARETVDVTLPAPTASEIANLLTAELDDGSKLSKVRQLVMEAVHGIVISAGKVKVDADLEFNQESVDAIRDDLSIYTIANLPRAERNMVTNSDLEAFAEVYKEHAAGILDISQKAVDALAYHLSSLKSFRAVITKVGMPAAIQARLEDFVGGLDDELLTEHGATIEWLNTRLEDTMKVNIDPSEI